MKKKTSQQPVSPESMIYRMERLMGGAAKGKKKREQEAQDLVYDSWEAADAEEAIDLLTQATELDPANVDAWLGLLAISSLPEEEQVDILRRLVEVARENLGKEFEEFKGHFWGFLETRPYMRARGTLAEILAKMGRLEEAMVEQEAMLELNPGDNQGVRYELMAGYLATNRLEAAQRLFAKYDERKYSAIWSWAFVLERFLSGAETAAEKALKEARKQNPYAQAYLLGHRKPPRSMPGSYAMGSREEAIIAWNILQPAWDKHPEAQAWLQAMRGKDGGA